MKDFPIFGSKLQTQRLIMKGSHRLSKCDKGPQLLKKKMKLVCVFFVLSGFVSLALGRIDHAKAKRGCEGRILFLTDYGEKRRLEILVFAKN